MKIRPGEHTSTLPPGWSWMAVDGPIDFLEPAGGKVQWNDDDVVLPFLRQTQGSHLQPTPQTQRPSYSSAKGDVITATAFSFVTTAEALGERTWSLRYDDGAQRLDGQAKCVIICTSKDKKEHHVLLVSEAAPYTSPPTYERVGAGILPVACIFQLSSIRIAIR